MFHIDLIKNGKIVTVDFEANSSSIGQKWSEALMDHIDMGAKVGQRHRIYNLNEVWSEEFIISNINQQIDIINEWKPFIDFSVRGHSMSQDDSNRLHYYFEQMRGDNEIPNEFYLSSPRHVRRAIEEYNVLIHRWESLKSPPRIVVHMKKRPTFDMTLEDMMNWSFDWKPGSILLNYCHKGKHLYDVFKDGEMDIDNQQHVTDENITPQSKYSADFQISFSNGIDKQSQLDFNQWFTRNSNRLNSLGFYRDDPRCTIGQCVVGSVIGDIEETLLKIRGSTEIDKVWYS